MGHGQRVDASGCGSSRPSRPSASAISAPAAICSGSTGSPSSSQASATPQKLAVAKASWERAAPSCCARRDEQRQREPVADRADPEREPGIARASRLLPPASPSARFDAAGDESLREARLRRGEGVDARGPVVVERPAEAGRRHQQQRRSGSASGMHRAARAARSPRRPAGSRARLRADRCSRKKARASSAVATTSRFSQSATEPAGARARAASSSTGASAPPKTTTPASRARFSAALREGRPALAQRPRRQRRPRRPGRADRRAWWAGARSAAACRAASPRRTGRRPRARGSRGGGRRQNGSVAGQARASSARLRPLRARARQRTGSLPPSRS